MTHNQLMLLTVATGALFGVTLALAAIAVVVGETMIATIAAVVAATLAVMAALTATRLARRLAGRINELSTQIQNLERRRESDVADVRSGFADHVAQIESESEQLRMIQEELDEKLSTFRDDVRVVHSRIEDTVDTHRRQLSILRGRVPAGVLEQLREDLDDARGLSRQACRLGLENSLQLGRPVDAIFSEPQARKMVHEALDEGDLLATLPLLVAFPLAKSLPVPQVRRLYGFFRAAGYWEMALHLLEVIHGTSGRESDGRAVGKIRSELDVFSRPVPAITDLPAGRSYDSSGPIVHVVGRVLPATQTGYTLRTHYTAVAQAAEGLRPIIVGQSGSSGTDEDAGNHYTIDGVEYFVLPGEPRSTQNIGDWLVQDTRLLAHVVLELRPSILHAHSDFLNASASLMVGRHFNIPVVYETRGFWEESWLSRLVERQGWGLGYESLLSIHGLPFAYSARRNAEKLLRASVDHVFTLAEVMREHIVEESAGVLSSEDVSIVSNAVEPDHFPVQTKDEVFASDVGIPSGALVIGYVSSIVEYEGIDVLIDAFHQAQANCEQTLCLLLVGDGDMATNLRRKAADEGIEHVIFSGRVPHEEVLKYYGLIDLFVVPRSSSPVTELVTPLKPFEAFSTGRTVIMSDVRALKEIAEQSGAVELFRADDAPDLARVLSALVNDEGRRSHLAHRGATWVRRHRTWQRNVSTSVRAYKPRGSDGTSSDTSTAAMTEEDDTSHAL